ncbi:MAG TPA: hypothetical protein VLB46_09265 [Pyrinomonadaceae bacterium]|nr:hypothetical protein [Pyrinomonadaceae bacterium]
MNGSERFIIQENSQSSRIVTYPLLDQKPPAFRVSWINWDSSFRQTGLRVGDQVIAVNGVGVSKPKPDDPSHMLSMSIGQYAESEFWEKAGLKEGAPLTLTVRRRQCPGEGWMTLEFTGELRLERKYINANERWIIGPSGPEHTADDGFSGAWTGWYEQIVRHLTNVFETAWQPMTFSSRFQLETHLEYQARVDYLNEHYPGPLATALKEDWLAARDSLMGRRYEISPEAQRYRRVEEQQAQEVATASRQAWETFLETKSAETVQAFPGVDPIRGDLTLIEGKYVTLPPIGNRDWITEGNHNWLASGQDRTYYYIDTESPAMESMFLAIRRYKKIVTPNIREEYELIGRVLPEPRLMVVNGRGVFGLQVEPVAALVGNAMFVDLTVEKDGISQFPGEEELMKPTAALPPDDATPRQVMESLVAALKEGDLSIWKALFADWRVSELLDGRPVIHADEVFMTDSVWDDSRRRILGDVYGIEVAWTSNPRDVIAGHEFEGAPHIEEVTVEVDHIGNFDGEYRAFSKASFNRFWTLQRVNDGPWRITSVQGI